ncbi:MAG: epoxyqueuosine reductase QueH [Candidatus Aminicenantales bacterium]|jgi:predicted adenine nucleotide alpha hydrolase (AANH) superfamily ATPase
MAKPRILVHVCCAPDALYVLRLLQDEYEVTGFFTNSNIHPAEEYALRLDEARKVAELLAVPILWDGYDPARWLALTERFKAEPEKGRRCDVCYALRLRRTAETAAREGFDVFATVMSLSPWKKAAVINRIGRQFGKRYGVRFLEADFKKKDGFKKSVDLSRGHGLYRQSYCGCLYSRDARQERGL